jgi:hypothetical protein
MGTGKTFTTTAVALMLDLPVIVICPLATRKTWLDVINTYGVKVYNLPETGGIITYETLCSQKNNQPKHGLLYRHDMDKTTEFYPTSTLARIAQSGVLIIFDECQKLKNKGKRNKAAHAILSQIYNCGSRSRSAFLSGSALDKEAHAVNFLRVVGFITSVKLYSKISNQIQLEGIQELYNWSRRISDTATTKFINENPVPTTRDAATEYVFNLFIQVIKPGIMSTMPRPNYNGQKDVKNGYYALTPQDDIEYQQAINNLASSVRYIPETGAIYIDNIGSITTAMIDLQKAKMRTILRIAREELAKVYVDQNGEYYYPKVILYADYYEILDYLKVELTQYNPLEVTGRLSEKIRNNNIDKFQEHSPNYRLLLGNPLAGGLGINLHDTNGHFPRTMFIMPNYRINEIHQATGRVFRDGIVGTAKIRFVYGLSASNIKETNILDALSRKGEVMQAVHNEQSEYGVLFPNQYPQEIEGVVNKM